MTTLSPSKTQINSVIALYSNGQIEKAIEGVEALIKDYPDEALLFNISGVCYKEIGQLDTAVQSFEKSLAIKPDYTEVNYNLGLTLQELGQLDAAVKSYEQALAIKPDYAEAHNNLGVTLKELGQLDMAIRSYKKALTIKPSYAEANSNLGNAFKELGQLDDAIKSYEKVLSLTPENAEAYSNLGNALQELGQLDAAVRHYEQALTIKPDYAEAHNNLGIALQELGHPDVAVQSYEKAITIKPNYAEVYHNLGNVFWALGQRDTAVKNFEKAVSIKPDYFEAHHSLSVFKKHTANDPQITQMQSLLSTSDLSQSDRVHLCFALAKVNEDLGNQEEFFKFLHKGNRLRKEELNYSLDQDQNLFSIVKKMFSSAPSLSYEPSTIRPVFIVGMTRSGTSLVEQIIASHHAVYGAGELGILNNLIIPIVKDYANNNKNSLSKKTFFSIRQRYLDLIYRFNVSENIITDKMPLNFRWIGFILSAFPEAKIVHLKRDARATCWSNYKHYFSSKGLGFPYNMDDLAGFYGLYADLMDFWHQTFPDKIYDLCYEDLTTNQEEETKKLLQYCELDWDENCLNFHTNKRAVKTASALQVRQKMYQGSSEAWKKHEEYLQPLIKALSS